MGEKILVVEDNQNVLHLNRSVLARRGYEMYPAENLRTARRIMEQHPYIAVAVLDIILPDGDGLKLSGEVKETLGCPVLMLTSKWVTSMW